MTFPEHGFVLIPAAMCVGASFTDLRWRQVTYKFEHYVQLEYSSASLERLAAAGIRIQGLIQHDYTWPGKFTPFKHQIETADFMVQNLRSFIFNDIGTGKTLAALWAADYLMNRQRIGKVLICSTLSTLNRVWESEVFVHLMHRTSKVIHGSVAKRRANLAMDADFYIINHEGLRLVAEELKSRTDITHVIMDEGARFRNGKTALWDSANVICGPESGRTVWWMTGAPMPRAPTDVWAQARAVNPDTVPKYFSRFRDMVMLKMTMFKWVPKKGWEDTVYSAIQPSIRFKRAECIDLPPCQYIDHIVPMSKLQQAAYTAMRDDYVTQLQDGIITASNEGAQRVKLMQLASGSIYDAEGNTHAIDCSPKKKEIDDIIEEVGTKLIIFAPFRNTIGAITSHLDAKHADMSYGVINGQVGRTARDKIFLDFQSYDLDIIVAHPAAMAHGLTLTSSNTIVWWGPVEDFEIYEQANGRITRPGQERHQYIKHLICCAHEKKAYTRLRNKESMQGLLLDMIDN